MNTTKRVSVFLICFFLSLQLIHFDHANPALSPLLEINTSKEVRTVFEKSCYDCHSNKTNWPWYSNVAPISWIVYKDVYDAREWVNFSEWEGYDDIKKRKIKKLIFREINGAMPMHAYLIMHQDALLDSKQKELIRQWCGITILDVNMRD